MLTTLTFHIPPPAGSTAKGSARRAVPFIQDTSTLKPLLYGLRWWEHHAIKSIRGKKVYQWEEHEYCRATFQVVGGDRHSNSCQRGCGDIPGGQLRKGLQSTQSKRPLLLPSPIALAAIGQSNLNMAWTQRCKPTLGATSCNSSPSICSGLLVAQSPKFNAQSPGFNVRESHQNHHANTILGAQSHTTGKRNSASKSEFLTRLSSWSQNWPRALQGPGALQDIWSTSHISVGGGGW